MLFPFLYSPSPQVTPSSQRVKVYPHTDKSRVSVPAQACPFESQAKANIADVSLNILMRMKDCALKFTCSPLSPGSDLLSPNLVLVFTSAWHVPRSYWGHTPGNHISFQPFLFSWQESQGSHPILAIALTAGLQKMHHYHTRSKGNIDLTLDVPLDSQYPMTFTALTSTGLLLNPCHIPQERQSDQSGGHRAKEGKASMIGVRGQIPRSPTLREEEGGVS